MTLNLVMFICQTSPSEELLLLSYGKIRSLWKLNLHISLYHLEIIDINKIILLYI